MSDYNKNTELTPDEAFKLLTQSVSIYTSAVRGFEHKLITFLYKNGFTQQEIADQLGISKQAVAIRYPRKAVKWKHLQN